MRQVVLQAPRRVDVVDAEPGAPGADQAEVRLRWAGICGSDLSAYRGTSPLVTYPRVLGHELLVDVLRCDSRPALVGRRAVVEPLLPCGRCRACRLGRYNCCVDLRVLGVHADGGMRERAVLPADRLYAVPGGLPDEVAALAEPTAIAYHAVQRSGVDAGSLAVVMGAGAIGQLIAQLLLRARGCRVIIADVDPWRLEVAGAMGAAPVRSEPGVLREAVASATDGEMADVVFEATGQAQCTRMATDLVAHAGRIVLIGWNRGPVEFDSVTLMRKEADLIPSRNSAAAFGPVLHLLAAGVVDARVMITHRFALDEARAALELLDTGGGRALKVLISGGA